MRVVSEHLTIITSITITARGVTQATGTTHLGFTATSTATRAGEATGHFTSDGIDLSTASMDTTGTLCFMVGTGEVGMDHHLLTGRS